MGFGQGLSGLRAASDNLDVIGNNISNSATVGFKAATISFADVYANSRVGLGVQVASVDQRFTTGNVRTTGNQFDMAIDGDNGFFRLTDQSGQVVYSRNGEFHADKNFNIVNAQGYQLTGYTADDDGKVSTILGPVKVPIGNVDPQATSDITVKTNLDSRSEIITTATQANVMEPENHTHSLPMTIYDSLGNPHQLTQYFVKTAETANSSTWQVYYVTDNTNFTVGVSPQTLAFDDAGRLTTPAAGTKLDVQISGIDGAENIEMEINYAGTTQFGGDFTPSFTQNGFATGEYTSMEIASNGDILANYTNGESRIVGAIALADFNNVNGLQPIGGNAWIETAASGEALLGTPGTNGLATLKGQAVEESNVDMSEELVNMIIAQRTYQANAQTIKTQDQILQTLITLR